MSLTTVAPAVGGFDDHLAEFLATVPAARDFDLHEYDAQPRAPHRPARGADKRAAIHRSLREG
jgi:hypothetical protein